MSTTPEPRLDIDGFRRDIHQIKQSYGSLGSGLPLTAMIGEVGIMVDGLGNDVEQARQRLAHDSNYESRVRELAKLQRTITIYANSFGPARVGQWVFNEFERLYHQYGTIPKSKTKK